MTNGSWALSGRVNDCAAGMNFSGRNEKRNQMTGIKIDENTGLPELPEGQYWHVGEGSILAAAEERGVIVSVRKAVKCDTVFCVSTTNEDLTALEALRQRQTEGYYGRSLLWGRDGHGLPDLHRVEVEISGAKRVATERTRKRFMRPDEVVETRYTWTGTATWESFETLFSGHTDELTEDAVLLAAIAAVEDNAERVAEREFIDRVTGDYPPNTL